MRQIQDDLLVKTKEDYYEAKSPLAILVVIFLTAYWGLRSLFLALVLPIKDKWEANHVKSRETE